MENHTQENIRIIGGLGDEKISLEHILEVLKLGNTQLEHNGEFMGKPSTYLKYNDHYVLKLHPDKKFSDEKIATRWLNNLIEEERNADVYHPSRTWFIQHHDSHWHAGNITLRLTPIHTLLESANFPIDKSLSFITIICDMYLSYVTRCDKRLDEGLSNFGFMNGKIYYLDDDIYIWDHFFSFSAWVAGWLRRYSHTWLKGERARQFGKILRQLLDKYFHTTQGIDAPHIVAGQIKDMFFPQGNIQDAADCIIETLTSCYQVQALKNEGKSSIAQQSIEDVTKWFDEYDPIAILSDIHANLPALKATLADIDRQNITRIFVLGDLVGYGPHPKKCLELLQKRNILSLRGNHDHAIGTGNMVRSMTSSSSHVAEWTIQALEDKQRAYLSNLPLKITQRPWIAVHGAPMDMTCFNGYIYQSTALNNLKWMVENSYKLCLHGHSHFQGIYILHNNQSVHIKHDVDLSQEQAALICPGSVGQPRDGITKACYAVVYPRQSKVEFQQVSYELREVIQDMVIHHFPEQLMQRLKTGT